MFPAHTEFLQELIHERTLELTYLSYLYRQMQIFR
jgi:hypothetical protein